MKKGSPQLKAFLALVYTGMEEKAAAFLTQHLDLVEDPAALVNASLHGRASVVEKLLKHGADPDAPVSSHERYRPLHRAIEHRGIPKNPGHVKTVQALLAAGADPEARSTWMGLTALATAGMAGDSEMIQCLHHDRLPLDIFHASILAESKRAETLLKKNPSAALDSDSNGMTPLHYAALSGLKQEEHQKHLTKISVMLCAAGADLNSRPKIGPFPETPVLHFAAWGKNLAVAKTLLKKGANPNLGFPNCLWREPGELGELFVKHGAEVNARESSGQPLLHSRVHWNLTSVVLWLLKKGADPNLKGPDGNTALHEAAKRRASPKIFEALLKHGAKENLKNKAGETAKDIVRKKKP